jgi:LysR family cys regulon transcriptional activator
MNLRQLAYLREVATNGYSVSAAAKRLHTSQPGISQQILALERELGMTIFVRERNRLVGLTKNGQEIVRRAGSALLDIEYIREFARSATVADSGPFVIATTHTQARYVLPEVLSLFARKYPKVRVTLQHGNPEQIRQSLLAGTADIGVTPHVMPHTPDIAVLRCREHRRIVLAPKNHPLARRRECSLRDIARYPLVTFEPSVSARQTMLDAFEAAGLAPNIILSAIDADVVKACVERGLGLTTLADVAYDPKRDIGLALVRTRNLFPPSVTNVTIHRKHYLQPFVFDFVEMFAPQWTRRSVEQMLAAKAGQRVGAL